MIQKLQKNIKKHLCIGLLILSFSSNVSAQPGCGCDELYDPLSPEYDECIASCGEVIIPVNGNIWLLVVAGIGFAFYQFRKQKAEKEQE